MKGAKFEDVAKRESADSVSGAAGRRSRQGRQEPVRSRLREGRVRAEGRRAVAARAQPVRLPHHSRRRAQGRYALAAPHSRLDSRKRFGDRLASTSEADTLSRRAANSEQGAKLDTAARDAQASASSRCRRSKISLRCSAGRVDSERECVGVRRRQGRRDERPLRRRERLLHRATRLVASGRRAEVREREGRGSRPRRRSARRRQARARRRRSSRPRRPAARWRAAAQQAGKKVEHDADVRPVVDGAGPRPVHRADRRRVRPAGGRREPAGEVGGGRLRDSRRQARASRTARHGSKQKQAQRAVRLQQLRQQKIQMFLQDIRKAAKVDDRRKEIQAATRRAQT